MERMPKVSIIVPVYNTEKYLRKCLDSLVNQTMDDIEIVVIDDGSTDHSPEIIAEYKNKYPEKFLTMSQSNSGQAAARNSGIKACHGEYVGFLDSDDYMALDFCQVMYGKAKENDADYVACGYTDTFLDEHGNTVILKDYVASKPVYKQKDLYFEALVSPWLHLYKHKVLRKSRVQFPEGIVYEDITFYMNLIPYINKVAFIERALIFRLRRPNSTTTSFRKQKLEQIFKALDEVICFYKNNNLWEKYRDEVTYMCVKILTCSSVKRISQIDNTKDRRELTKRTLNYLDWNFSNYRKNHYLKKGLQNLYIRSYSKCTAGIITLIFRKKYRQELQFS